MATPQQKSRVNVQVVCLANGVDFAKPLLVPMGQTVGWCVNASGLYGLHPVLRDAPVLAVWGQIVVAETLVAEGDRIEVHQPVAPAAQARVRATKQR